MNNNNLAIESFINFCDDMMIAEEKWYEEKSSIKVNFFGSVYEIEVYFMNVKDEDAANQMITDFITSKPWESKKMWDQLYKNNKSIWDEVNNASYYDGKTVKSPSDLMLAIKQGGIDSICVGNRQLLLSGYYWIDPEHGWGINFPNGKFVPQGKMVVNTGHENNCTYLTDNGNFREYDK